ncbi:MAG TPA: hypothetical protein VIW64_06740 [Pyrinomonadaceae bacterium]|jgi:hypothetical protein
MSDPSIVKNLGTERTAARSGDLRAKLRKFSWASFALILVCFFFPFVYLSFVGNLYFTGFQLAFGTEIPQPTFFGPPRMTPVAGYTSVLLTLLLALAGTGSSIAVRLGRSLIRSKWGNLLPAICGALGFILTLIAKSQIQSEMLSQAGGLISFDFGFGFTATTLLFLIGAALHGYLFYLGKAASSS